MPLQCLNLLHAGMVVYYVRVHKNFLFRPLPDLLPFPFTPDESVARPKKNLTKVPKPSKFIKGWY